MFKDVRTYRACGNSYLLINEYIKLKNELIKIH